MKKSVTKPARKGTREVMTARAENLIAAQIRFVRSIEHTAEERIALRERDAAFRKMTRDDWRTASYVCGVIAGWSDAKYRRQLKRERAAA